MHLRDEMFGAYNIVACLAAPSTIVFCPPMRQRKESRNKWVDIEIMNALGIDQKFLNFPNTSSEYFKQSLHGILVFEDKLVEASARYWFVLKIVVIK